ncbi:hypothetical protein EAL2_c20550 [Peptoclostridium acidaminophilum DSM 3953]|uniref:Transposase n=1 Tax=Peptoclostridium acidaminophilum DSM 3953 TaxID=1286171 RepID=W8U903_PEPAC|nr:hypothetical protein [Peptoclostridium acidaminophilum]AHM57335.1 hypothetical protein EAL2_c20540 [Peptoclostridium acidaminophilum DSM 3953]AHM57336.1 hypothetical protein EAL2_c20550 [Peptoclostridium acidaminophilum DSM 3953]
MSLNDNREIWVSRIDEFRSSNLTQKAWCEKNDVKISTLRYWIRKLSYTECSVSNDSGFSGFEFASVSISKEYSPPLALEFKDVKLSIAEDFDETLLIKLLSK